jgi:hypothetical protein
MSIFSSLFKTTVIDTIVGYNVVKRPDPSEAGDYLVRMYTKSYVFSMACPDQTYDVYNIKRVTTRKEGEEVIAEIEEWGFIDPSDVVQNL